MAKRNRKVSARQRDKTLISLAKRGKELGLISKQAKLHSGQYISKGLIRKVEALQASIRLGYRPVAVKKDIAKAAQERGFQVIAGNKIIGPSSRTFKNRLKAGELTGVRPVKGGMMEEVILPHSVFDLRSLVAQLQEGIDTLKLPGEQFAFKYKGNESFRAFMNSQDLLDYLMHYKSVMDLSASRKPEDLQEEFESITIFRLHPSDISRNLPTVRERAKRNAERRAEAIRRGEYVVRKVKRKSRSEWLANMPDWKADKIRAKQAERDAKRRAEILANPEKLAYTREQAKKRAKAWREKQKQK